MLLNFTEEIRFARTSLKKLHQEIMDIQKLLTICLFQILKINFLQIFCLCIRAYKLFKLFISINLTKPYQQIQNLVVICNYELMYLCKLNQNHAPRVGNNFFALLRGIRYIAYGRHKLQIDTKIKFIPCQNTRIGILVSTNLD